MRIVFAGSPAVAVPVLRALLDSTHTLAGVISQPERPVGRGRVMTPTPVSLYALERAVALATPDNDEPLAPTLRDFRPDLAIAVAYGRLIDPVSLALPPHGWWNLHFSLLPAWRGAAPVQHAILSGASQTGVSVFEMDAGLDTGDILAQQAHPIEAGVTAGQLLDELAHVGATLVLETVESLVHGELRRTAQTGPITLAPKLGREDARLRWSDAAEHVDYRFRACTPEPGAWTVARETQKTLLVTGGRPASEDVNAGIGEVVLHEGVVVVGCAEGAFVLEQVTPAGGRSMSALEWWRGAGRGIHFEP